MAANRALTAQNAIRILVASDGNLLRKGVRDIFSGNP